MNATSAEPTRATVVTLCPRSNEGNMKTIRATKLANNPPNAPRPRQPPKMSPS